MIAHISVPVKNYNKAKEFYKAVLGPTGYVMTQDHPEWEAGGFMEGGHTSFWIVQKEMMTPIHVAVIAPSKQTVRDFYEKALAAGATDNGAPGFRTEYGDDYYAAFVLDPDGNNLEACFFGETAPKK
jgi:catechol 2,3-dioxygenase-like lactoylglutathione lyase family enzyme